jgi:hypothetical protein
MVRSGGSGGVFSPLLTHCVLKGAEFQPEPTPAEESGVPEAEAPPGALLLPLERQEDDTWTRRLPPR